MCKGSGVMKPDVYTSYTHCFGIDMNKIINSENDSEVPMKKKRKRKKKRLKKKLLKKRLLR